MDNLVFKLTVQDDGSAKISAFESKIRGLQQETITLSSRMKDAFNGVGNIIVDFAAKAGREFVKFSSESVKAFLAFENAMVAVAKTTGIPKANLGQFSEQIRETAVNLKGLGKDAAVQIANIAEVAGQLGIASDKLAKGDFEAASKEILGFSTTIAKAKIALPEFTGGVEEIATVIAKQIQLYGETPAAAEQYLSVMNKLSDTTAATAKDIAGFLKNFTMAPTLKILQEEAAAWGATFVSLGQNPYDAATRMQSAYAMILKGSKDTNSAIIDLFAGNEKMAKQLEELAGRSVKVFENGKVAVGDYSNLAREAIGKDANGAMKLFVTTLSEVESSSERAEIATKMFGQVGAKAILTLIPELPKLSAAAKEAATTFLSTNEEALDSLAKMSGVSRDKFSDNADFMAAVYKKDMPDAIRVLVDEINKIDDETEKARVASEVFGENWEVVMNKAEGGVKKFDENLVTAQKEIEATANGASSIQKEYETALDKVGTSFSELTAIMDDLKLQWGAPLAEALSAGIKLMIPVLEELRKNFVGVVEEFGKELGGETLGNAFKATAEAFKGTIEEMGANADIFIQTLKEQFTLPNLFKTALDQWYEFAVWVGDKAAGLAESLGDSVEKIFTDIFNNLKEAFTAIAGAVISDIKEMASNIASVIKEMIPGGSGGIEIELTGAEAALSEMQQLRTSIGGFKDDQTELQALYKEVWNGMKDAIAANEQPSEDLTGKMRLLREEIKAVGVEAYGNSTFPDMTAAMQTSQAQTQALTAEMQAMEDQIKSIGKEYEETNAQIKDKQKTVRDLNSELRDLNAKERTASKEEKDGIQAAIVALQNKRGVIQNELSDLQNLASDQKEARQQEIEGLKESIEAQKEKIRAVKELQDNTQRTAELRAKQQQEEMKAANDLYQEQQKQAADSLKWLDQLDDAAKKRVLGEKDAVTVLKSQGVTLTTLQEQELRRMQGAYKTEQAYEAQAKALQSQLSPMSALMAAGDKLSNSLGGLSSGIGKVGNLFNIDTSGITGALNKVQEFAQLPQMFDEIKNSFSGIKDAFSQLKGLDLKSIFSGGGGGISGLISSLSGIGSVAGIIMAAWTPLKNFFKGLFEDTKSQGTEAANAFQDFVSKNVTGGAEMAGAMKESFDQMTAANFNYQTFLQQTGSTMSQVMGGLSQNWQQGTTAMDIFTQAVVKSGVEVSKAPQVALQMTAAMDAMGLSTEQAAQKMVEVAEKAGMSSAEIEKLKAALEQTSTTTQETSQSLQGLSSSSVVASMGNMDDAVKRLQMRLVELGVSENEILSRTNQFKESFGQNKIDDFVKTSEIAEALSQVVEGYRNAEGQIVDLTSSQYKAVSDLFQKLASDQQLTVDEIQTYRNKLVEIGIPITELDQKLLALGITQDQINAAMASVSMATYNAENEKAIEITNRLNSEAQQRIALWQNMGLSTDEINIKLQELGLTTEQILNTAFASTNPMVGALASAFDDLSGNAALSADAHTQLANSLAQVTADGQVTSAEIGSFVSQLQSAGVPVVELSNNLLQLAQNAGMTPAQIQALSSALSEATGSVAALDNELVGHSLVPSLQLLSEAANASQTPLMGVASAAITAANGTKTASTEVDTLQAALAAGGEEGASTTEVFDAATQAAETLAETTQSLTSDVSGLTSQLSGAGAEGGDTAAIFRTATGAAQQLSGQTSGLSGQVSGLAHQLANTGGETIDVTNLFRMAGGSADSLSMNMDGLASMAAKAGIDIDALRRLLEALPARKDIEVNVKTNGTVPAMARGGEIGATGLAIVNELGSEVAKFPGGSMALMTARGPVLGAFPVGTEIIPHHKAMQIVRDYPTIPRMATGGTITAGAPVTNNYYQYTVNLNSVIDRNTARMIDAELQKLSKQRAGV